MQQQNFEQVADGFGVADDVVTNGLVAVALAGGQGDFKNSQLAAGVRRIAGTDNAQRPCVGQQAQQQRALVGFTQAGVAGLELRRGQQFGNHFFMLV